MEKGEEVKTSQKEKRKVLNFYSFLFFQTNFSLEKLY
jgi:hypothetical protein